MATTEDNNNIRQQLWERLRSFFSANGSESAADGQPERPGVAITICVSISVLLWFTMSMRESYPAVLEVPTRVVNLPEGEALTQLPPSQVRVQVEGEGYQLLQLALNPPEIVINAAREQVDLEAEAAPDLPKNVRLTGISPRTFEIRKEPRVRRKIPIQLRAEIDTPPTHDLIQPTTVEPDSVIVSGARSIVNDLHYWPTVRRRFTEVRDSVVTTIALADTLQGLVDRSLDQTAVVAVAREFSQATREIDVIVQGEPSTDKLVTLDPATIRVTYRVPLSQYEQAMRAADFYAEVPYEVIRTDTTGRVRPLLHIPADLVLKDVEMIPSTLRYFNVLIDE